MTFVLVCVVANNVLLTPTLIIHSGLSYSELRAQCGSKGLEASGSATQLKRRLLEHITSTDNPHDETRAGSPSAPSCLEDPPSAPETNKTCQAIAKEFICPITHDLPFDPVTAEDGRVYERNAIQVFIDRNSNNLNSPFTGERMGSKLLPSPQIRNIIEQAIDNGDITGDLADSWITKRIQKENIMGWKKEGLAGNGESAREVAMSYYLGENGLLEDDRKANMWWKIAAYAGDITGLSMYGEYLLRKKEARIPEKALAISFISEAAAKGSKLACLSLGRMYFYGEDGLPECNQLAKRFLQQGLDKESEDLGLIGPNDQNIQDAKEVLRNINAKLS